MDRREKPEQKGGNEGKSYMKEWSESMDDSGKRKKKVLSRFWAHREHKQDMNAWICWRSGAKSEGSWVKECSQVKMMRTRRVVSLSVPSLSLCLSTSLPRSLLGRLTLPFIHLTAHRRGDEWRSGEGWKSGMRGEGRMSIRQTSKCSPADLLEERRERETDTHTQKQRLDARTATWLQTAQVCTNRNSTIAVRVETQIELHESVPVPEQSERCTVLPCNHDVHQGLLKCPIYRFLTPYVSRLLSTVFQWFHWSCYSLLHYEVAKYLS